MLSARCTCSNLRNTLDSRISSAIGKGSLSFSTSVDLGKSYGSEIFCRREQEARTHNRLRKHGLAWPVPITYCQIPILDPDTEEISIASWPFLLPHDFVATLVSEGYREVLGKLPEHYWANMRKEIAKDSFPSGDRRIQAVFARQ
ncbi:unnamed protein product [Durusdinium trenchii]|uniref:Uncharacterized protein n=1 Tax=Durusdinium trenchii TaxID=1381693 RepID=A0ABP0PBU4_9DINO